MGEQVCLCKGGNLLLNFLFTGICVLHSLKQSIIMEFGHSTNDIKKCISCLFSLSSASEEQFVFSLHVSFD